MPAPRNYYPDAVSDAVATVGRVLSTDTTGTFGTDALAPNVARASFLGFAPRDITSATVRWAVTTGGAAYSATWAELALATGTPSLGAGPTLTVAGYTSVQASVQAGAGAYNTTVTATIAAGTGVWAVWATAGGLSPTLRVITADAMQPGFFAQNTTASWRPSSNVGVATAWALSSTTQDGVRAVAIVA